MKQINESERIKSEYLNIKSHRRDHGKQRNERKWEGEREEMMMRSAIMQCCWAFYVLHETTCSVQQNPFYPPASDTTSSSIYCKHFQEICLVETLADENWTGNASTTTNWSIKTNLLQPTYSLERILLLTLSSSDNALQELLWPVT